jgi:serine/threonine-protein kinase
MASVFLARADGPGRFRKWFAIKRSLPGFLDSEARAMFLDEARLAARFDHPNLVHAFELGEDREGLFLVMEYLHGESLRALMRAAETGQAPLPAPGVAARLLAEAAHALHSAHELTDDMLQPLHVVHRDVSPQNLFLTFDGRVKVLDFGIARASNKLVETQAGTLKGKLGYLSPEQARGRLVDRRSDIFSLGVVGWELTTGRRLYRGVDEIDTLRRALACRIPSPSRVRSGYPDALAEVLMRALAAEPDARWATAAEFAHALEQFGQHAGHVSQQELAAWLSRTLPDARAKRDAVLQLAAAAAPLAEGGERTCWDGELRDEAAADDSTFSALASSLVLATAEAQSGPAASNQDRTEFFTPAESSVGGPLAQSRPSRVARLRGADALGVRQRFAGVSAAGLGLGFATALVPCGVLATALMSGSLARTPAAASGAPESMQPAPAPSVSNAGNLHTSLERQPIAPPSAFNAASDSARLPHASTQGFDWSGGSAARALIPAGRCEPVPREEEAARRACAEPQELPRRSRAKPLPRSQTGAVAARSLPRPGLEEAGSPAAPDLFASRE